MPFSSRTVTFARDCSATARAACNSRNKAAAVRTRPPLAPSLNISTFEAMGFSLFNLEGNDAFEHHPVELSTLLDVRIRIPEVLLVHILGLRQHVRRDEPAAAKLPTVGADLTGDGVERA